jgi:LPXTG-motif cell wall-anchored protein
VGNSLLPTTGADLAAMVAAGLGAIGVGIASMLTIRRRRAVSRA